MFRLIFDLIRTVFFLISMAAAFIAGGVVFNLDRLGCGESAWKQYSKYLPLKANNLLPGKVTGMLPKLPGGKTITASVQKPAAKPRMTLHGRVAAVLDGDTVILISEGRKFRVRLYGIDAPETAQAYGPEAGNQLRRLILGQNVTVEVMDIDSYGRAVSRIRTDEFSVNREMVRIGAAWHYRHFAPDDTDLAEAQVSAQREKRGLWRAASPVPPWEFRRNITKSQSGSRQNL